MWMVDTFSVLQSLLRPEWVECLRMLSEHVLLTGSPEACKHGTCLGRNIKKSRLGSGLAELRDTDTDAYDRQ